MTRLTTLLAVVVLILGASVARANTIVNTADYNSNAGTALDFSNALNVEGQFSTEYQPTIESGPTTNHSTVLEHVTVEDGSPNPGWDPQTQTSTYFYDFFEFTVSQPNMFYIFDIDNRYDMDTYIWVLDAAGNVVANNDDSPFHVPGVGDDNGGGGVNGLLSYLRFTFQGAGTYYLRVGEYDAAPGPWTYDYDIDYTLHISRGAADPVPEPASIALLGGLAGLVGVRKRRG